MEGVGGGMFGRSVEDSDSWMKGGGVGKGVGRGPTIGGLFR